MNNDDGPVRARDHGPSRRSRAAEITLLGAGLLGLGYVATDRLGREAFQARLEGQLEQSFRTHEQALGSDTAGRDTEAIGVTDGLGSLVGKIRIDRIDLSAMVAEGVDRGTLSRAVGHVPRTALPGERGNAVLAGHRDSFFRELRHVQEGDEVDVLTRDGTFHYRVVSTNVVAPEHVDVLRPTVEPRLTLVTCYPFSYIGAAPQRFIVVAEPAVSTQPEVEVTSNADAPPSMTKPDPTHS